MPINRAFQRLKKPRKDGFFGRLEVEMKVINLINKLNEIGYDENTELTFSCVDGDSGECYDIPFDEISFGENLTGEPYHNDVIDIGLDVDSVKDYIKAKSDEYMNDMIDEIRKVLYKHDPWRN